MIGLNALIPLPTTEAPFLIYDKMSERFSMFVDRQYYDNSLTDPIKVYVNDPLFVKCFMSMPVYNMNSTIYKYQILCQGNHTLSDLSSLFGHSKGHKYLEISQERNTFEQMSDFNGIVITTSMFISNGMYRTDLPSLIDYKTNNLNINNFHNDCVYTSCDPYRYVKLIGQNPISNFEIRMYCKNKMGILTPISLPTMSVVSMKIMFQKKGQKLNNK